jgi:hypothetical protein
MSISEVLKVEEDEEKSAKVISIRPGIYSGGGGNDLGDHWLSKLPKGSVFLSRPRGEEKRFILEQWLVVEQHSTAPIAQIFTDLNQNVWLWVDTIRFSHANECVAWETPPETKAEMFTI